MLFKSLVLKLGRGSLQLLFIMALTACGQTPLAPTQPVSTVARGTPTGALTGAPIGASSNVVLTLSSWRPEDTEPMNRIFARFSAKYPHITIKYNATPATEYDAVLASQLKNGTGPDLLYLRSFSTAQSLYTAGYLERLDMLPGLQENFTTDKRLPWSVDERTPYGVPFIATSHAVYYNINLFNQLNLPVPTTWEDFLTTGQTLKKAGIVPLANASGDKWTMAEIVFMNLAPNFIGGREGRAAYLTGRRCFNDANMTAVFQAMQDLAPLLPDNQAALTYADSQQLFLQGRAAMWLGGSWDIPTFEAANPKFEWGVFAPPPPAGQKAYLTFHLDAGLGLNAASTHKPEAQTFLSWMTTLDFATALGDELPGLFPMHTQLPPLANAHAQAFLALNQGRSTDIRLTWDQLSEGTPPAYTLIMDEAVKVVNGQQSPQAAANTLQTGLAEWFPPAQKCGS